MHSMKNEQGQPEWVPSIPALLGARSTGPTDQVRFMRGCDQTTSIVNFKQVELYLELIREEMVEELFPAILDWLDEPLERDRIREMLDGAGDTLVVVHGLLYSLGLDPAEVKSVIDKSNLTKIPKGSHKVRKRSDGKILKPEGFKLPELDPLIDQVIEKITGSNRERKIEL